MKYPDTPEERVSFLGQVLAISVSGNGIKCLKERGGAYTNSGYAVIIANYNGQPKVPLKVMKNGNLACEAHAIIPVQRHDWVIVTQWMKNKDYVSCLQIEKTNDNGSFAAEVDEKYIQVDGVWAEEPPQYLHDAIHMARLKAHTWHCRKPLYTLERPKTDAKPATV